MDEPIASNVSAAELTPQKQQLLLAFYQHSCDEISWRRNAGYRTIILGFGYFGVVLVAVAFNHQLTMTVRSYLAVVIGIGTLFGSGYLASNYCKYMSAAKKLINIEQFVGAFDPNFLGSLGALMPASRRAMPDVPLWRNPICIWSVLAFAAGGLLTATAILIGGCA